MKLKIANNVLLMLEDNMFIYILKEVVNNKQYHNKTYCLETKIYGGAISRVWKRLD